MSAGRGGAARAAVGATALGAALLAALAAAGGLTSCVEVRQREAPSGELLCRADAECPTEAAVCDLAVSRCVQCLPERAEACTATSPVCGEEHACRGCRAHEECASELCLPDGSCAAAADIAYAAARGAGTACTQAAPCPLLSTAAARGKPYVKVSGAIVESNGLALGSQAVKIFGATGAALTSRDKYVVRVVGTAGVSCTASRSPGAVRTASS